MPANLRRQLRGPIVAAGHACLDLIPTFTAAGQMPGPGQLAEVGAATVACGGSVPNTGLALHKLGLPVRLIALIGEDLFGRGLSELLAASGAELRLRKRADVTTSYSVVLSPPGRDRSFLHSPGANHAFSPEDVSNADLRDACALHFGYPPAMRQTFEDGGRSLANLFRRATNAGLLTSLDMCFPDPTGPAARVDWAKLLADVLPHVSLFCPSHDEMRALLKDSADVPTLAEGLLHLGAAAVAIKLGADGLYLRTTADESRLRAAHLPPSWLNREIHAPCFATNVITTTGSGDCTIAGLLAATLAGHDAEQAATYATAVGAYSVEAADATGGIRPWEDVVHRVAAGWPHLQGAKP